VVTVSGAIHDAVAAGSFEYGVNDVMAAVECRRLIWVLVRFWYR
jgi:hypothetical protein